MIYWGAVHQSRSSAHKYDLLLYLQMSILKLGDKGEIRLWQLHSGLITCNDWP